MRKSLLTMFLVVAVVVMLVLVGWRWSGRKAPARAEEAITLIDGSCEKARDLGDLAGYSLRVRSKEAKLGFVRVRSDASWFAEDKSNILGTVPTGTVMRAEGPLKNAEGSNGIGYAVAVRDKDGRTGRGYVSYTVVDVLPGK